MLNQFSRTQLLFGKEAMERLYTARVAEFGVGGVGLTLYVGQIEGGCVGRAHP